MSKLVLDGQVPDGYNKATFTQVIRAICNQLNTLSEGKVAARYQAQESVPASVAAAVSDFVWDSNATVASGTVRLGWVCNVESPTNATFQEVRALTEGAATQAQQEAGSSTTTFVTPGRQQYHPSAAKAWVNFNGTGTTVRASYNVTSITDNGTGDNTVNFTTAFSGNDSYSWAVAAHELATGSRRTFGSLVSAPSTTAFRFEVTGDGGGPVNTTYISAAFYGDQ